MAKKTLNSSTTHFGLIVQSVAGRDRKRVFVVMGETGDTENMRFLVTDGKLRKIDSPKRKNPYHVKPMGYLTQEEMELLRQEPTDRRVREILALYDRQGTPEE